MSRIGRDRVAGLTMPLVVSAGLPLALSSMAAAQSDPLAEPFPAVLQLVGLDGTTGFRLDGISAGDYSGESVASAGDVNGDGVDDLIIGAIYGDPGGRRNAGETYVVFGRDLAKCPADLDGNGDLTLLDFLAFRNLFDAGDPLADFDGDGRLTLFDFLAFQNAFDDGCP